MKFQSANDISVKETLALLSVVDELEAHLQDDHS